MILYMPRIGSCQGMWNVTTSRPTLFARLSLYRASAIKD